MVKARSLAIAAVLAVGVGASLIGCSNMHSEVYTGCAVDDKDRSTDPETGSSVYRIYSSCGVFEVEDNFLAGNFNSADLYGSIQVGSTYDFDTIGWRNGLLSMFPNITSAKVVSE